MRDFFNSEDDVYFNFNKEARQAFFNRKESIRSHFCLHIEECGNVVQELELEPNWGKFSKLLTKHKLSEQERAHNEIKDGLKLIEKWMCLGGDGPSNLESWDDLNEKDFKAATRFNHSQAEWVCQLFEMDEETAAIADRKYSAGFYLLQWELIQKAQDVLRPYLGESETTFFDWILSGQKEFEFHYENTNEANAFADFVRENRNNIRTILEFPDLRGVKQGWHESPQYLLQHLSEILFVNAELVSKEGNYPNAVKALANAYGIRYAGRTAAAKDEVLQKYRQRVAAGLTLTPKEKSFANALGGRLLLTKRGLISKRVIAVLQERGTNGG